jgi:LDH2 family malate/lactate/ureidoglycolate dehydrogenase
MSISVQQPHRSGTLRLTVQEARELGARSLRRLGFIEDEADLIVDHLVDAELCGYSFAGLARILVLAERAKEKEPQQEISVVHETDVSAVVDGGNKVGYLVIHRSTQIAIEKAKRKGFALVSAYNSIWSGRNAYYLERIARADLVGIHTTTSNSHLIAPLGGARGVFSTNPIAFGFPSSRGPVIIDMGTAAIQHGELQLKALLDEELPEGMAIDAEGKPTRNPREALLGAVLPFGGHKGYGLSFTVQVLGLLGEAVSFLGRAGHDGRFLLIVFDPGLLVSVEDFKKQVSELIDQVKSTPRQPGVNEILIPSERAFRDRERNRIEGIVLHRAVYDALKAL